MYDLKKHTNNWGRVNQICAELETLPVVTMEGIDKRS